MRQTATTNMNAGNETNKKRTCGCLHFFPHEVKNNKMIDEMSISFNNYFKCLKFNMYI